MAARDSFSRSSALSALAAASALTATAATATADVDTAAFLQFVLAVGHHHIARFESVADSHVFTFGNRDGYGTNTNLLFFHEINVVTFWPALNRRRWGNGKSFARVEKQAYVDELVREESKALIVEN